MPSVQEVVASYVPTPVARRFAADPTPLAVPEGTAFPAAALFADVSGFTALTERLAQEGPAGAERLTGVLNDYFGRLLGVVTGHGGDVVKFAGDALLAVWPVEDPDERMPEAAGLADAVGRAAQCGLAAQEALRDFTAPGGRLTMRIGVGGGQAVGMHVGGTHDRWEFLVAGDTVTQAAAAQQSARPGQVVVSPQVRALLGARGVGETLPSGGSVLRALSPPVPPRPAAPVDLPSGIEVVLRPYLPEPIRARIDAGHDEWLAELRRATVLFVGLPGLQHGAAGGFERLHAALAAILAVVHHYEGTILRVGVDDKGTVVLGAFGLPPLAHEDDPARGAQAAVAIRDALHGQELRPSVGVTTGRVYCGAVGGATKREYTVMGDAVNLAARLMQAAGDVWCDAATQQAAGARVDFEAHGAVAVRGKAEPVVVFRPRGERRPGHRAATAMVGRIAERATLRGRLHALAAGRGGAVVVEGAAGLGKSRLVLDLLEQAEQLDLTRLAGAGDAIERARPYRAWLPVFARLVDWEALPEDPEERRARVLERLPAGAERLAPLLNSVLPLDLPENELTAQLTGDVRADNTRELLAGVLRAVLGGRPAVLVMDDAHWLDSTSWALLRAVAEGFERLLVVVALRPLGEPLPLEYRRLLALAGTDLLRLETMAAAEAAALVRQRLGVVALPAPVAELIERKAQGNPFFSEELAYALRDAGLIRVIDGACQLQPDARELAALDLPDTIQGVITTRIDRIPAAQQLALKVASVVGRIFALPTVRDVHPIDADRPRLAHHFESLARLDLILPEETEPELAYIFTHVITQDVAYNLLPFAQRRELHRAVAEWYEQARSTDLASLAPVMAHHWSRAGVAARAVGYLETAGEHALRSGAYEEAIGFFGEALRFSTLPGPGAATAPDATDSEGRVYATPLRRARWERQMGAALNGLGRITEAGQSLERGAALLDRPIPKAAGRLVSALLGEVGRQTLHRRWPGRFLGRGRRQEEMAEMSRICQRLGMVYYVDSAPLPTLYVTIRGLNLAERAGALVEMAQMYASMALATGLIPLFGLARHYARLALEAGLRTTDSAARGWVHELRGSLAFGFGEWESARTELEQALALFENLGARRPADECRALLGAAAGAHGEFVRGLRLWEQVVANSRRRHDVNATAWGLTGQADNLLSLGRVEEAIARAAEAIALREAYPLQVSEMVRTSTSPVMALARLRRDEVDLARPELAVGADLVARPPTAPFTYAGYTAVPGAYLAVLEITDRTGRRAVMKAARRALGHLGAFARVFPIGRPRFLLYKGLLDWADGHPARARRSWESALAAAGQLDMPYEQALALRELGRRAPLAIERDERLARAAELFRRLGAAADLAETEALARAA
jgi:class 3 adenylate cyclase/tetratricopeptide (TPR) repeat protein